MNPYTGLALIDDPAVVTIQINNEDTAIKGNMGDDAGEEDVYKRQSRIINNAILSLDSEDRANVLIIDDSMFERNRSKKVIL